MNLIEATTFLKINIISNKIYLWWFRYNTQYVESLCSFTHSVGNSR